LRTKTLQPSNREKDRALAAWNVNNKRAGASAAAVTNGSVKRDDSIPTIESVKGGEQSMRNHRNAAGDTGFCGDASRESGPGKRVSKACLQVWYSAGPAARTYFIADEE